MHEFKRLFDKLPVKPVPQLMLHSGHAIAELTKRKLSFFVQEFWPVIVEDPLEWNWHMDVLCDEVQFVYERVFKRLPKLYDLLINISPGTTKSTIVTILAPAWAWGRDPTLRIITGSYSGDLSTQHAVKSRDVIKSDKFRLYFPDTIIKADEDNKTNYGTSRNGQRFATSIGGTATGVHGHVINYDDPINPKQAVSVDAVQTANDHFDHTLSTRKTDKRVTPLILTMQRLATNDPTGHLLDKKKMKIRQLCLPATLSSITTPGPPVQDPEAFKYLNYHQEYYKQGGFMDFTRLGPEVLEEMKASLGTASYAGQFDQTPTPAGGLVWQKWFIEVPDDMMPSIDSATDVSTDWDLAYTNKKKNAASAYITTGMFGGKVYIFDLHWQWLEFPALIKWMKKVRGPHYIEAKASGKSAKQTLSSMGVVAIEVEVQGGEDKVARARSATPLAESGDVYISKSLADRLYNDSKQGILFFPKGQFMDVADVLAQALQRRMKHGKIVVGNPHADGSGEDVVEVNPLDWLDE